MLKKEHEILYVFAKKPWKKLAFREIKILSKKKSESYVFGCLKKMVKQQLLNVEKAGNVSLYSLNLKSLKAQCFAGFAAEFAAWNKKQLPYETISAITTKIPTAFYSLIITGSYASGKQRKDSDIDMVIICDESMDTKQIYAELRHSCEMSIPPIHLYVFKKSEFKLMLADRKANYGKETANNCLLLAGGREYYSIINEAVQNGFNG
ncbi:MAG: nucleotidyltransferase domain-containing protein [Nanoarchaeota archaeon]|nr:nucleotidyltransferase domain-containing protein [Nanoarchaeota archaeon]